MWVVRSTQGAASLALGYAQPWAFSPPHSPFNHSSSEGPILHSIFHTPHPTFHIINPLSACERSVSICRANGAICGRPSPRMASVSICGICGRIFLCRMARVQFVRCPPPTAMASGSKNTDCTDAHGSIITDHFFCAQTRSLGSAAFIRKNNELPELTN